MLQNRQKAVSVSLGLVAAVLSATFLLRGAPPTASASSTAVSIWSPYAAPLNPSENDSNAVELGVKFRASVPGTVSGIRFYKSAANTGIHVGNLWSADGTRLATAFFTSETVSGWQQVNFATPVPITAGTTYIASYHTDAGHYADDQWAFAGSGVTNGPLEALSNGADGANSVYTYGSSSSFPSSTWNSSNYWVDVVFNPGSASASATFSLRPAVTPTTAPPSTTPPVSTPPATTPPVTTPPVTTPPVTTPPVTTPPVTTPPTTPTLSGGLPAVGSSTWQDSISSTTSGPNEGHPHGVPSTWDWYSASNGPWALTGGDSSLTGWGTVYWNADFGDNPGNLTSQVEVSDFHVWLSTTSGWQEVQNGQVQGGAYAENFADNNADPINIQSLGGDAVSVSIPADRVFHFYPQGTRPSIPGNYTGHWIVTVAAQLTQPDPSAHWLLAAGLDWWQSPTAQYPNNTNAGQSREIIVPDDGSPVLVGFTDLSAADLALSHP